MANDLVTWALPRIEQLLPLDSDSLRQIVDYTNTLPKDAAAEHLKNLLGDSPQALEFISSFNSRRRNAPTGSSSASNSGPVSRQPSPPANEGVPRPGARPQKKKKNIHSLPARQVEGHGNTSGAYVKQDEQDYMAGSAAGSRQKPKGGSLASALSLSTQSHYSPSPPAMPSPSTASHLIVPHTNSASASASSTPGTSRTSSPAPAAQQKAKVTITGGKAMHGSSTTLSDLDSAIRSLELQTNPVLSSSTTPEALQARQCNCMATTHALLTMAPNCLNCGNIICVKQGLGPCISCGAPLLSREEISSVLRVLKDERGKERQAEGNRAHKRADISQKPRAFSGRDFLSSSSAASSTAPSPLANSPTATDDDERGLKSATQHRDRLLAFQAQNAQRTTVHDEAADFASPVVASDGSLRTSSWASPLERAKELKKQQRLLREMEFNARPEWEKRRVVASIDVVKGKVVRRFVEDKFEEQGTPTDDGDGDEVEESGTVDGQAKGGVFSHNPLLGKLIRPVFKAEGTGRLETSTWRRVQDDNDDNEDVILDGGTRGFAQAQEVV
ncbi:hypothetical protein ANO11243_076460 [Dothideomycetidae sp. 11243]|nr:hypothetical protein ANO11243_076460 [fungal sp. No.11243]